MTKLKCKICHEFKDKINGRKHFSKKWIEGADSLRLSSVRDHAKSDQHAHAMNLFKRRRLSDSVSSTAVAPQPSTPIERAFAHLPKTELKKMEFKFDIARFVANEGLPFTMYAKICQLEASHGVSLGSSYLNESACKEFIHFIAEAKREALKAQIQKSHFFSLLLYGSTDKGNIDNEMFLLVWCDTEADDEKIHTRLDYFTVLRPRSVTAVGLKNVLEEGLLELGISDLSAEQCHKLVGIATDGASANIAAAGLKGLVEQQLDWIFWMWCFAHRLELAVRDALKSTALDTIDTMLLRMYYLYENSPKKCRELEEIIKDLTECYSFDTHGIKPVRASGSRWVTHKLHAMKRILSNYGAYLSHIAALASDSSVKQVDRAKLKGYYSQWSDAKCLLGCALFSDLLTPCATFSKSMQKDEIDLVEALSCLLKTTKELENLSRKPIEEWPTYAATMKKFADDKDGSKVYQGTTVKKFTQAVDFYSSHYAQYCANLSYCIKTRLSWNDDLGVMRDVIFFLASHGWEKHLQEGSNLDPVERLVTRFAEPLSRAGADASAIPGEFLAMIEYAVQFISLSSANYHSVWWKLFHAPDSGDWPNALLLAELLFSLPASNGKLERMFSLMGVIKSDKRTRLTNASLNDLLMLKASQSCTSQSHAQRGINLWWKAKNRRPEQRKRKKYKRRGGETIEQESESASDSVDSEEEIEDFQFWHELQ